MLFLAVLIIGVTGWLAAKDLRPKKWYDPAPRHHCDHPSCTASFLSQAGLSLHDRAAHGAEDVILWPHALPPRNRNIVTRKRLPPRLRLISGYRVKNYS